MLAAAGLLAASCYGGTSTTVFPPGLEPWESPNAAMPPPAEGENRFPETLSFARRRWTLPGTTMMIASVHARAFLQVPITTAWRAARDPQTGRDPVASQGFAIRAWAIDPMYAYSYRTHVLVNSIVTLEWDVEWRHGVVEGTLEAPTVVAARWQKTEGASAIEVIEGSLVLRTVEGQPNVTEVQYQYHLKAPFSDAETIVDYLNVVFARLKDRAHDRPLTPNDCTDCPPPPAGY